MGTANKQIRVSEAVKRELEQRRHEGESFNDVLERLLDDDRDLLAGFGAFSGTDRAEAMRAVHERGNEESGSRVSAMTEARTDE
jgi:predicted CopG family antitoxin